MTRASAARLLIVVAVVASLAITAVGVAKQKPPQTRSLKADAHGQIKFNKTHLTVHAGRVKLVMTNPKSSGQQHGIAVSGHGVGKDGKIVNPGKTSTITVTLKKGKTYTFFCPVPGHEQLGMKGKITVN
jgi:plastocyanin